MVWKGFIYVEEGTKEIMGPDYMCVGGSMVYRVQPLLTPTKSVRVLIASAFHWVRLRYTAYVHLQRVD